MGHSQRRSLASAGPVLDRLRRGGKKTAVASGLIAIMLLMWVRVFIGHRPAAAAAAPPPSTETLPRQAPAQVKLIELPKLPGRHDSLERDFFTISERSSFRRNAAGRQAGTEKEVPVVSLDDPHEVAQRIAKMLKLKAVSWSESPRALINDQLLRVGSRLTVKDGTETWEFEVLQIYVDSVLVGGKDIQLTLPLAQSLEVTN